MPGRTVGAPIALHIEGEDRAGREKRPKQRRKKREKFKGGTVGEGLGVIVNFQAIQQGAREEENAHMHEVDRLKTLLTPEHE